MKAKELERLCQSLGAFETDRWAARAILSRELMTPLVVDPCSGLGMLAREARAVSYRVFTIDIVNWKHHFDSALEPDVADDFLNLSTLSSRRLNRYICGRDFTIFMNPPFHLACEFVDAAMHLGARKIVCFQRQAWRESIGRQDWFAANRPARVYTCASRATCWRFDKPERTEGGNGSKVAHSFYVWERGHNGIEAHDVISRADCVEAKLR